MTSTTTRVDRRQIGDGRAETGRAHSVRRSSPTLMAQLNRHGILIAVAGLLALAAVVATVLVTPRAHPAPSLTPVATAALTGLGVPEGATTVVAAVDGQNLALVIPGTPAVGLAVFLHDEGADATAAAQTEWIAPLVAAGWAVASGDLHGDSWGSPAATSDLLDLVKWSGVETGLTPSLFVSDGMGALVSLNSMTRGAVAPACWYGVESITDLASLSGDGATARLVAGAYRGRPGAADNPVDSAGTLATAADRFRLVGADGEAPFTAAHSGALAQGLAAAEASVTVGEVSDPPTLAADLVSFANGCGT